MYAKTSNRKMKSDASASCSSSGSTFRDPNEKQSRIISVGWKLNDIPVREKRGGGTRAISISKKARRGKFCAERYELVFQLETLVHYLKSETN